ncbi:MAG: hypothetical protein NTZ90_01575 [Proteobacteria bacterium]|nr:hypothetical protein [Pseudomonadota bacterium]
MPAITLKRTLASLAAVGAVVVGVLLVSNGCGVIPPHKTSIAVGSTVTLKPVALRSPSETAAQSVGYPNVHLVVNYEGKLLSPEDKVEVWIYENAKSPTPLYKLSTSDLVNAYKTTKCTSQLVTHLNNAIKGDGLFCSGALDVKRMGYFVLKIPGHEDEIATSLIYEYADPGDQVVSVVIPFT